MERKRMVEESRGTQVEQLENSNEQQASVEAQTRYAWGT